MPIPDYQSLMSPILGLFIDGREYAFREISEKLADQLGLTDEEKNRLLPSGKQNVLSNRIGWALTYLKQARVLESVRKGVVRITERGQTLYKANPTGINNKILDQFPEFKEFRFRISKEGAELTRTIHDDSLDREIRLYFESRFPPSPIDRDKISAIIQDLRTFSPETPTEAMERNFKTIRAKLASELLEQAKKASPTFFEKLVVDLLLAMGYGGSRKDFGEAIGKPGDEGVDGVIKQDRLGLDKMYVQAKKWEGTVGRGDIQKFVGSLDGKHATKGVFITTGKFTDEARKYAESLATKKIILIDGQELGEYMIDHGIGTIEDQTYAVKKLDLDYFTEE